MADAELRAEHVKENGWSRVRNNMTECGCSQKERDMEGEAGIRGAGASSSSKPAAAMGGA